MMQTKTKLRAWGTQADAIAKLRISHDYRYTLIEALRIQLFQYIQTKRPLWLIMLIDLLYKAQGNMPDHLSHTEVKALLHLFKELCFYFEENFNEWWLQDLHQAYDADGFPIRNDHDPFTNFVNNIDDEDDTQGDDPVPW